MGEGEAIMDVLPNPLVNHVKWYLYLKPQSP
ncbi:hypothetical protein SRA_10248 [Streptococcus ratti FA-1 = DSM 20564]|uniref:Uncharacterized protein n=1 Tax=Streptococcus ratti FA-1 = DSM 20564 TaxID=699248 RepID=A0ABN0GS98_STRRT|nr:hypothetical protein SRA_10248 [Streptococcus ratti FA-1 = DSM 20564]